MCHGFNHFCSYRLQLESLHVGFELGLHIFHHGVILIPVIVNRHYHRTQEAELVKIIEQVITTDF